MPKINMAKPLYTGQLTWENVDIMDRLLAKGADIHAKDKYGQTPLHLAAYGENVDIIDRLLAKGGYPCQR